MPGRPRPRRTISCRRLASGRALIAGAVMTLALALTGCGDPTYDRSSPEAAIDAALKMVADGRPDLLPNMLHIAAREITYEDGVTEASAINDVREKTSDMLHRLHRISRKLRDRFPDEIREELGAVAVDIAGGGFETFFATIVTDPFRFMNVQRERIAAIDFGDGTAAILMDGEPPFGGIGLQMTRVSGEWMIEIPLDHPAFARFRPDTRHEWAVVAAMMLGFENSLKDFERDLDRGEFRDLRAAGLHVGRLMSESAVVQALIYTSMKQQSNRESRSR